MRVIGKSLDFIIIAAGESDSEIKSTLQDTGIHGTSAELYGILALWFINSTARICLKRDYCMVAGVDTLSG